MGFCHCTAECVSECEYVSVRVWGEQEPQCVCVWLKDSGRRGSLGRGRCRELSSVLLSSGVPPEFSLHTPHPVLRIYPDGPGRATPTSASHSSLPPLTRTNLPLPSSFLCSSQESRLEQEFWSVGSSRWWEILRSETGCLKQTHFLQHSPSL